MIWRDNRNHSCMFTKYNNSPSDKALREAYSKLKIKYKIYSFLARMDERQYNSGVDLPITSYLELNMESIQNIIHLLMILMLLQKKVLEAVLLLQKRQLTFSKKDIPKKSNYM